MLSMLLQNFFVGKSDKLYQKLKMLNQRNLELSEY